MALGRYIIVLAAIYWILTIMLNNGILDKPMDFINQTTGINLKPLTFNFIKKEQDVAKSAIGIIEGTNKNGITNKLPS